MDFFKLTLAEQTDVLTKKIEELKNIRFQNDLPIVYKTDECFHKPELFVYEYRTGNKELIAFNTLKQREKVLLKYR